MLFSPQSSATRTDRRASSRVTWRNSWPSDDAPKLRIGSCRPVWPKGRVFIGFKFQVSSFNGLDAVVPFVSDKKQDSYLVRGIDSRRCGTPPLSALPLHG